MKQNDSSDSSYSSSDNKNIKQLTTKSSRPKTPPLFKELGWLLSSNTNYNNQQLFESHNDQPQSPGVSPITEEHPQGNLHRHQLTREIMKRRQRKIEWGLSSDFQSPIERSNLEFTKLVDVSQNYDSFYSTRSLYDSSNNLFPTLNVHVPPNPSLFVDSYRPVVIHTAFSSPNISVYGDGTTVSRIDHYENSSSSIFSQKPLPMPAHSAVARCGHFISEGCWYYEVTILSDVKENLDENTPDTPLRLNPSKINTSDIISDSGAVLTAIADLIDAQKHTPDILSPIVPEEELFFHPNQHENHTTNITNGIKEERLHQNRNGLNNKKNKVNNTTHHPTPSATPGLSDHSSESSDDEDISFLKFLYNQQKTSSSTQLSPILSPHFLKKFSQFPSAYSGKKGTVFSKLLKGDLSHSPSFNFRAYSNPFYSIRALSVLSFVPFHSVTSLLYNNNSTFHNNKDKTLSKLNTEEFSPNEERIQIYNPFINIRKQPYLSSRVYTESTIDTHINNENNSPNHDSFNSVKESHSCSSTSQHEQINTQNNTDILSEMPHVRIGWSFYPSSPSLSKIESQLESESLPFYPSSSSSSSFLPLGTDRFSYGLCASEGRVFFNSHPLDAVNIHLKEEDLSSSNNNNINHIRFNSHNSNSNHKNINEKAFNNKTDKREDNNNNQSSIPEWRVGFHWKKKWEGRSSHHNKHSHNSTATNNKHHNTKHSRSNKQSFNSLPVSSSDSSSDSFFASPPHYTPRPLLPGDVIGCLIYLPPASNSVSRREAELHSFYTSLRNHTIASLVLKEELRKEEERKRNAEADIKNSLFMNPVSSNHAERNKLVNLSPSSGSSSFSSFPSFSLSVPLPPWISSELDLPNSLLSSVPLSFRKLINTRIPFKHSSHAESVNTFEKPSELYPINHLFPYPLPAPLSSTEYRSFPSSTASFPDTSLPANNTSLVGNNASQQSYTPPKTQSQLLSSNSSLVDFSNDPTSPPTVPLSGSFMVFFLNGRSLGIAAADLQKGFYTPAVSLFGPHAKISFNFGPHFKYPPADGGEVLNDENFNHLGKAFSKKRIIPLNNNDNNVSSTISLRKILGLIPHQPDWWEQEELKQKLNKSSASPQKFVEIITIPSDSEELEEKEESFYKNSKDTSNDNPKSLAGKDIKTSSTNPPTAELLSSEQYTTSQSSSDNKEITKQVSVPSSTTAVIQNSSNKLPTPLDQISQNISSSLLLSSPSAQNSPTSSSLPAPLYLHPSVIENLRSLLSAYNSSPTIKSSTSQTNPPHSLPLPPPLPSSFRNSTSFSHVHPSPSLPPIPPSNKSPSNSLEQSHSHTDVLPPTAQQEEHPSLILQSHSQDTTVPNSTIDSSSVLHIHGGSKLHASVSGDDEVSSSYSSKERSSSSQIKRINKQNNSSPRNTPHRSQHIILKHRNYHYSSSYSEAQVHAQKDFSSSNNYKETQNGTDNRQYTNPSTRNQLYNKEITPSRMTKTNIYEHNIANSSGGRHPLQRSSLSSNDKPNPETKLPYDNSSERDSFSLRSQNNLHSLQKSAPSTQHYISSSHSVSSSSRPLQSKMKTTIRLPLRPAMRVSVQNKPLTPTKQNKQSFAATNSPRKPSQLQNSPLHNRFSRSPMKDTSNSHISPSVLQNRQTNHHKSVTISFKSSKLITNDSTYSLYHNSSTKIISVNSSQNKSQRHDAPLEALEQGDTTISNQRIHDHSNRYTPHRHHHDHTTTPSHRHTPSQAYSHSPSNSYSRSHSCSYFSSQERRDYATSPMSFRNRKQESLPTKKSQSPFQRWSLQPKSHIEKESIADSTPNAISKSSMNPLNTPQKQQHSSNYYQSQMPPNKTIDSNHTDISATQSSESKAHKQTFSSEILRPSTPNVRKSPFHIADTTVTPSSSSSSRAIMESHTHEKLPLPAQQHPNETDNMPLLNSSSSTPGKATNLLLKSANSVNNTKSLNESSSRMSDQNLSVLSNNIVNDNHSESSQSNNSILFSDSTFEENPSNRSSTIISSHHLASTTSHSKTLQITTSSTTTTNNDDDEVHHKQEEQNRNSSNTSTRPLIQTKDDHSSEAEDSPQSNPNGNSHNDTLTSDIEETIYKSKQQTTNSKNKSESSSPPLSESSPSSKKSFHYVPSTLSSTEYLKTIPLDFLNPAEDAVLKNHFQKALNTINTQHSTLNNIKSSENDQQFINIRQVENYCRENSLPYHYTFDVVQNITHNENKSPLFLIPPSFLFLFFPPQSPPVEYSDTIFRRALLHFSSLLDSAKQASSKKSNTFKKMHCPHPLLCLRRLTPLKQAFLANYVGKTKNGLKEGKGNPQEHYQINMNDNQILYQNIFKKPEQTNNEEIISSNKIEKTIDNPVHLLSHLSERDSFVDDNSILRLLSSGDATFFTNLLESIQKMKLTDKIKNSRNRHLQSFCFLPEQSESLNKTISLHTKHHHPFLPDLLRSLFPHTQADTSPRNLFWILQTLTIVEQQRLLKAGRLNSLFNHLKPPENNDPTSPNITSSSPSDLPNSRLNNLASIQQYRFFYTNIFHDCYTQSPNEVFLDRIGCYCDASIGNPASFPSIKPEEKLTITYLTLPSSIRVLKERVCECEICNSLKHRDKTATTSDPIEILENRLHKHQRKTRLSNLKNHSRKRLFSNSFKSSSQLTFSSTSSFESDILSDKDEREESVLSDSSLSHYYSSAHFWQNEAAKMKERSNKIPQITSHFSINKSSRKDNSYSFLLPTKQSSAELSLIYKRPPLLLGLKITPCSEMHHIAQPPFVHNILNMALVNNQKLYKQEIQKNRNENLKRLRKLNKLVPSGSNLFSEKAFAKTGILKDEEVAAILKILPKKYRNNDDFRWMALFEHKKGNSSMQPEKNSGKETAISVKNHNAVMLEDYSSSEIRESSRTPTTSSSFSSSVHIDNSTSPFSSSNTPNSLFNHTLSPSPSAHVSKENSESSNLQSTHIHSPSISSLNIESSKPPIHTHSLHPVPYSSQQLNKPHSEKDGTHSSPLNIPFLPQIPHSNLPTSKQYPNTPVFLPNHPTPFPSPPLHQTNNIAHSSTHSTESTFPQAPLNPFPQHSLTVPKQSSATNSLSDPNTLTTDAIFSDNSTKDTHSDSDFSEQNVIIPLSLLSSLVSTLYKNLPKT